KTGDVRLALSVRSNPEKNRFRLTDSFRNGPTTPKQLGEKQNHDSGRSRTLYSSFQRFLPSRLKHHSSSVPTSVTLLSRCTGTVCPSLPGASSVVASGASSSIWPSQSSTSVPTASPRRTVEPR